MTGVSEAVPVRVDAGGAAVTNAIRIHVHLQRIGNGRTVVARVAETVAIGMLLPGIRHGWAVVGFAGIRGESRIAEAVTIGVGTGIDAIFHAVAIGIREGSAIQQHENSALEDGDCVLAAVMIKIADGHGGTARSSRESDLLIERPIAPPEQQRQVGRVDVRHQEIRSSVCVQIADRYGCRSLAYRMTLRQREAPIPRPEQDGDIRRTIVRYCQIGFLIAVEVPESHEFRSIPRIDSTLADEGPIAVSEKN